MKVSFTELGMSQFAELFPSLKNAEGIWRWSPDRLDNWAAEFGCTENELHSARYLLNLWNPENDWTCGCFDQNVASKAWDSKHREVFLKVSGMTSWQLSS